MSRRNLLLGTVGLVLLTAFVYSPTLERGGFVFDDNYHVTQNPSLHSGTRGLAEIWTPGHGPQFYPIVFTSFWIEHRLWGTDDNGQPNPFPYHLINVGLHAANALLVWWIFAQLGLRGAWLIGALFAVHPMHVESVSWIAERKNTLSAFFYLTAALAWLRFDTDAVDRKRWGFYAASLGLFVLALLSKSVTCSLPAALILITLYRRQKITRRRLALLSPMFVLGVLMGLVTMHVERNLGFWIHLDVPMSLAERVLVASKTVFFYPYKLVTLWPVMFNYPRWSIDASAWQSYGSVVAVLGLAIALATIYRSGRREIPLAFCYYAGTALPALGLTYVYPHRFSFVADHFCYLASLGVLALVVAAISRFAKTRNALAFSAAVVLVPCVVLARIQASTYESEDTVWLDTLSKNPDSWMASNYLAESLLRQAKASDPSDASPAARTRLDRACKHAGKAVELWPEEPRSNFTLSRCQQRRGQPREALRYAERALSNLWQRHEAGYVGGRDFDQVARAYIAPLYRYVGKLHEQLGDAERARIAYEQARAIDTSVAQAAVGAR